LQRRRGAGQTREDERNRVQPVFLIAIIVLIMVELLVLEEPVAVGRVAA